MDREIALHLARLAQLEGAVSALLREAVAGHHPNDLPDGMVVRVDAVGIDIEYTRGSVPIAGESL